MTSEEKHKMIKEQVDMMYGLIKTGERALEILREQCDHPESKLVNYSWAPGHIQPNTNVCAVCGKVLVEPWYREEEPRPVEEDDDMDVNKLTDI